MNSCRDPDSEVFNTWLPSLPWGIASSQQRGSECPWKVTQEVSLDPASGDVLSAHLPLANTRSHGYLELQGRLGNVVHLHVQEASRHSAVAFLIMKVSG